MRTCCFRTRGCASDAAICALHAVLRRRTVDFVGPYLSYAQVRSALLLEGLLPLERGC